MACPLRVGALLVSAFLGFAALAGCQYEPAPTAPRPAAERSAAGSSEPATPAESSKATPPANVSKNDAVAVPPGLAKTAAPSALPAIAPPPAGEIEILEELTWSALSQRMRTMTVKREGIAKDGRRSMTFTETETFTDPTDPDAFVVHRRQVRDVRLVAPRPGSPRVDPAGKRIVAEAVDGGSATDVSFQQERPRYVGAFAGSFGSRTGQWARWHDGGQPRVSGQYVADQRDGRFRCWFESGKLRWSGHYVKGRLVQSRAFKEDEASLFGESAYFVHEGPVSAVAIAPDGKTLAAGSETGEVRVWDLNGRRQVAAFRASPRAVFQVKFSRNGTTLAVACGAPLDSTPRSLPGSLVRLYDAATWRELPWPKSDAPVGNAVTIAGNVYGLAFTSRDRSLLVASLVSTAWEIPSGRPWNPPLPQYVSGRGGCAALSANGKMLAAAAKPLVVSLWDTETRRETAVLDLAGKLSREESAFKIRGLWIVAGPATGLLAGFRAHDILATVLDRDLIPDPRLRFWDPQTGHEIPSPLANLRGLSPHLLARDGKTLATCKSQFAGTTLWDAATGRERLRLDGVRPFAEVAFSPDAKFFAAPRTRALMPGDAVTPSDAEAYNERLRQLTLLGDVLTLVDVSNRAVVTLDWDEAPLRSHAFSPDSRLVAAGTQEHVVIVWDIARSFAALSAGEGTRQPSTPPPAEAAAPAASR